MSLTFKLFSLGIRTLAKPIGNYIKRQAKEHDGFRRFAINAAQSVHRIDMRMRLGILHDPAAQERMHERERKAAEDKKRKDDTPTVRTEKEQKEYDQKKERDEKAEQEGTKKKKEEGGKVKIRPLSDARAIELGANFFSEAFIFGVAVGLLLLENWRSRSKASTRRDEVSERLESLETEVDRLKREHNLPELEALNERIKRTKEARSADSWYNPAGWWRRFTDANYDEENEEGSAKTEEAAKESGSGTTRDTASDEKGLEQPKPSDKAKPPNLSEVPTTNRIDTVEAKQKGR